MLKLLTKLFFSLTICSCMLIAPCISSYAHIHPAKVTADRPGEENQQVANDHNHHHSHDHDSSHHADYRGNLAVKQEKSSLQESSFHAHVVFLFFEMTIPLDGSNDFDPSEENGQGIYLVRLIASAMLSIDQHEHEDLLENSLDSSATMADPQEKNFQKSSRSVLKNLLCDAARHRRSGVQLL